MKIFSLPEQQPELEINKDKNTVNTDDMVVSRRKFLGIAGGLAGLGLVLDSCSKNNTVNIHLGKGDTALYNYLYIIAQVQAGFYSQAYATPYYNGTVSQKSEYDLIADLRDHQLAYCGFYENVLFKNAISKIVLQLSQVTFADRTSTLSHATILQDWSVAAYNGVVKLLSDQTLIPVFAKIASVEGRHAEYVRDALNYNSFGDNTVINSGGLGQALPPNVVLPLFETYIQTKFDASGVPTF